MVKGLRALVRCTWRLSTANTISTVRQRVVGPMLLAASVLDGLEEGHIVDADHWGRDHCNQFQVAARARCKV